MWRNKYPHTLLAGLLNGPKVWKVVFQFLKWLNIELALDPEFQSYVYIQETRKCVAALFTIAKMWGTTQMSPDKWTYYFYYSCIKRSGVLTLQQG